jgi:hypothetical protein
MAPVDEAPIKRTKNVFARQGVNLWAYAPRAR